MLFHRKTFVLYLFKPLNGPFLQAERVLSPGPLSSVSLLEGAHSCVCTTLAFNEILVRNLLEIINIGAVFGCVMTNYRVNTQYTVTNCDTVLQCDVWQCDMLGRDWRDTDQPTVPRDSHSVFSLLRKTNWNNRENCQTYIRSTELWPFLYFYGLQISTTLWRESLRAMVIDYSEQIHNLHWMK